MRLKASDTRQDQVIVDSDGRMLWVEKPPWFDGHVVVFEGITDQGERTRWGRAPRALLRVKNRCLRCRTQYTEHNMQVCADCRDPAPAGLPR